MWFRIDDGFYDHPKADQAGTAALGLWARCGSYAGRHLTDGFVPEAVARRYGTTAMIRALLTAGLWDRADGGYRFHDWAASNPTRETVEASRVDAAERKRRSRSRRDSPAGPANVTRDNDVTARVTDAGLTGPSRGRVDPTRPDPDDFVVVDARATTTTSPPPVDNPGPDPGELAELVGALRRAGMAVEAGRVPPPLHARVVAVLAAQGVTRLVAAAKEAWRPDHPPVFVTGLLTTWETMPPPGRPLHAVPAPRCPDHPDAARTAWGSCARCHADQLVAAGDR